MAPDAATLPSDVPAAPAPAPAPSAPVPAPGPEATGFDWGSNPMIALYIALGLVAAVVVIYFVMRRTVRTRIRTEREVRDDPDIHDWLVIFNWTRKVLYLPTIGASVVAAVLMFLHQAGVIPGESVPRIVGGAWFAVFLVNFFVEEFEISVKVVLIAVLCVGAFFLWLHLLGWVMPVLRGIGRVRIEIGPTAYLILAGVGLVAVGMAWLRGLFYYVVFTPNYMNIQWGPTESGDHISREDFNTHVDTADVLERLMGFGRIIISFKDQKRPPMTLLVWRIGRRAQTLERVRGKFAIDLDPQTGAPLESRRSHPGREPEAVAHEGDEPGGDEPS